MRLAQQAARQAEPRFAVRIRIAVPPDGLGSQLDQMTAWPKILAWARRIEALPGFAAPFDLLAKQDAEIGF